MDKIQSLIGPEHEGHRLLLACPQTAGDVLICLGLVESIKELYPELYIYFATEEKFFDIPRGNPFIYKTIKFEHDMYNLFLMEGIASHKGYFEVALLPCIHTQVVFTYQHNQYNRFAFELFSDKLIAERNLLRLTK